MFPKKLIQKNKVKVLKLTFSKHAWHTCSSYYALIKIKQIRFWPRCFAFPQSEFSDHQQLYSVVGSYHRHLPSWTIVDYSYFELCLLLNCSIDLKEYFWSNPTHPLHVKKTIFWMICGCSIDNYPGNQWMTKWMGRTTPEILAVNVSL